MKGHRPSSLPVARWCGLSPILNARHGGTRSALLSNTFHKQCASDPEAQACWDRLTEEEQATLIKWHKPTDVVFEDGVTLRYADAVKETQLGLDANAAYIDPDSPDAVTAGTADFLWVLEENGVKTLYLADIKRGWYTQSDPRNLQNMAYGLAAAEKYEVDHLVLGLWFAEAGEWKWSAAIDMLSEEVLRYARAVVAAAMNTNTEPVTGSHCGDCYARQHCPEWMIPPEVLKGSDEATLALSDPANMQPHQAVVLRLKYERAQTFMEQINGVLRDWAKRNGGIVDPAAGKVWGPIKRKGVPYLNKGLLKERYPGAIEACTVRGRETETYIWKNLK